jgi:hypothetical protein
VEKHNTARSASEAVASMKAGMKMNLARHIQFRGMKTHLL